MNLGQLRVLCNSHYPSAAKKVIRHLEDGNLKMEIIGRNIASHTPIFNIIGSNSFNNPGDVQREYFHHLRIQAHDEEFEVANLLVRWRKIASSVQGSGLETHAMSLFIKHGLRRIIVPYFLEDTFQDSKRGSFPCTMDLALTRGNVSGRQWHG